MPYDGSPSVYASFMPPAPNRLVPGWTSDTDVAAWATEHGFGVPIEMTDRNLRKLVKDHAGHPVGLYLWEGEGHEIYIGISTDSVVKRLRRHLIDYHSANIQNFRYLPHSGDGTTLRDVERQCVWEAIWTQKIVVFNREYASSILLDAEFDELVPVEQQQAWFNDPPTMNLASADQLRELNATEIAKSSSSFPRFMRMPESDRIIDAISLYLRCAVPIPPQTQVNYWALSCLPGTKLSPGYKRISTLNMGILEMLWFNRAPSGAIDVEMGTDYRYLPPGDTQRELRKLSVEMCGIVHRQGGADEEGLYFPSLETFVNAMRKSPHIRIAAARFALDRMRKGKVTRHKDSHNYLLAEQALRRMDRWDIASVSDHA